MNNTRSTFQRHEWRNLIFAILGGLIVLAVLNGLAFFGPESMRVCRTTGMDGFCWHYSFLLACFGFIFYLLAHLVLLWPTARRVVWWPIMLAPWLSVYAILAYVLFIFR